MKGIVRFINPRRGAAVVETEEGFTAFDIEEITCALDAGDVISGDLGAGGATTLFNKTKNERFNARIEATLMGSLSDAKRHIL